MTAIAISTGALPTDTFNWNNFNWETVKASVCQLQMRIAKAVREGRYGKAKALQHLLTHSFHAKLLAVKRVTENDGKRTAGVDGVIWKTDAEKMQAVRSIKQRGYQPLPLRRIYIPKKNGKQRPLGIPAMSDRAQQALHLLALEPIAETTADKNSYGFRPKRSCHDAIEQCFCALAKKSSGQWILEGDIKACFDRINHKWLESVVPINKPVLRKWLKAGYIEKGIFHHTEEGTPQGGIISPTAANMVLDGMEALIKSIAKQPDKLNFVRYADDFVITCESKETLENIIKPAIARFLSERGLELSEEKTKITHINDGFDFLGFNIRKYNGKLLTKPAKKNVLAFLNEIRAMIKKSVSEPVEALIRKLNARIRGWANYYRHGVSKDIFSYVDHCVFKALWRWAKRKHPTKSIQWIRNKYFRILDLRQWVFFAKTKDRQGESKFIDLFLASSISIKRHIKIKAEANPFDPKFEVYFEKRNLRNKINVRDGRRAKRELPIF